MVKVSFVIRTLNEVNSISRVINLINEIKGDFEKEIVVVDSGSTDGTISIASQYKNVVLLKIEPKEWSWGYSLNVGIERASGDYIVVISGHCYIAEDSFLEKSITLLSQNHNVAALYGKQKPIDGLDPFEEWELFSWYPNIS
jgi:rhamnosyltransferase